MVEGMVSRGELDRLRAQVRRAEANAGRKVRRLKSSNDVDFSRNNLDPRRSKDRVRNYTAKQLSSYLDKLSTFNSRSTQIYGSSKGGTLDPKLWERYKRLESKVARRTDDLYKRYAKLPANEFESVEFRMQKTYTGRYMQSAVNSPYDPPRLRPGQVKDERALRELIKSAEVRSSDKYWEDRLAAAKSEFGQMSDALGDDELKDMVSKLTDKQFAGLWYYTNFANSVSLGYSLIAAMLSDRDQSVLEELSDVAIREAKAHVTRAKNWRVK